MTLVTDTKILDMWQTPVYLTDLRESRGLGEIQTMNAELKRLVLAGEAREEGIRYQFGVIGAQKSSLDILRWDEPAIAWFKARISDAVETIHAAAVGSDRPTPAMEIVAEAWAVVYRDGASHRLHTHHDSAWSGVYYIETGGVGDDTGHLQLLDPRPGAIARQRTPGVNRVIPEPGVLVCFPSWMPHSVKATAMTQGLRICLAFNVGYREHGESA